MLPIWGIDLGGTKIEAVILEDRKTLNVLKRMRIPTESHKGYLHVLRQISKLVETISAEVGFRPESIGLGHPGTLDPQTQTLKNCNSTVLNGKPMKRDLENFLGIPIKMANDANCFAIAEAMLGAVPEKLEYAPVVFGVIMGTGVGGGIVVEGKVLGGLQGIGGEWGHNFLDESGGDCYCGKVGCVEKVIAGPALEKYYAELTGISLSLKEINRRYENGEDEAAQQTISRLIKMFGKGISSVINILDPDAIVIGGGVGNIDALYTEGVEEVKKHVFNPRLDTVFLKPSLGDSAGVFGAALL